MIGKTPKSKIKWRRVFWYTMFFTGSLGISLCLGLKYIIRDKSLDLIKPLNIKSNKFNIMDMNE